MGPSLVFARQWGPGKGSTLGAHTLDWLFVGAYFDAAS